MTDWPKVAAWAAAILFCLAVYVVGYWLIEVIW